MDTNLTVHEIEDLIIFKEGGVRKNLLYLPRFAANMIRRK